MIKFAIFGEEKTRANLPCKIYRMYGLLRFEMITTSRAVGLFIWTKQTWIIDNIYDSKNKISWSVSREYVQLNCLSVAHMEKGDFIVQHTTYPQPIPVWG